MLKSTVENRYTQGTTSPTLSDDRGAVPTFPEGGCVVAAVGGWSEMERMERMTRVGKTSVTTYSRGTTFQIAIRNGHVAS